MDKFNKIVVVINKKHKNYILKNLKIKNIKIIDWWKQQEQSQHLHRL